MTFQMRGLEAEAFAPLFQLSDRDLATIGARRVYADEEDAYPCRISLTRVPVGEELLLLNHVHLPAASSPYRASGPIFVSRSARTGFFRGELAPMLQNSLLSLRAYDEGALMVEAEVAEGDAVIGIVERFLADPQVAHVDAHFARRGCFAARIERA